MKKETNFKIGDIVEDLFNSKMGRNAKIINVYETAYEWEYYPKQSDNYYHTDWAGDFLLYKETSKLIC